MLGLDGFEFRTGLNVRQLEQMFLNSLCQQLMTTTNDKSLKEKACIDTEVDSVAWEARSKDHDSFDVGSAATCLRVAGGSAYRRGLTQSIVLDWIKQRMHSSISDYKSVSGLSRIFFYTMTAPMMRSLLISGLLALGPASLVRSAEAVSAQDCAKCHANETEAWSHSDHAWSMRLASPEAVKAPFSGEETNFDGLFGQFKRGSPESTTDSSPAVIESQMGKGAAPFVIGLKDTAQNEARFTDHRVRYTFGHDPLQQFLIDLGEDRLQVAPFAFDTRPADEGGQQWIHLEAEFGNQRESRFQWHQPLQNWNGMCADCHSRGLSRNYNPAENRFDTQFDAVNVDCQSCHVVTKDHGQAPAQSEQTQGQWVRAAGAPIAHWAGPKRDTSAMEACFGCHSLRAPLTDGFTPARPFLDQFRPEAVVPPFYQADGQIEEEVYVYGSFLQSAMYSAGVQCMDCHDPHSGQVKAEGNTLCLTCHAAEVFDAPDHHLHRVDSTEGQCVSCHMPAKTYMSVDDRRDHRFAVPDPDLASALGSDDVCQSCHEDRWSQFKALAGAAELMEGGHALASQQALSNTSMAAQQLTLLQPRQGARVLALINQDAHPAILRASMLRKYAALGPPDLAPLAVAAAQSLEPVLRLVAADLLDSRAVEQKQRLMSLAQDPLRAVRIAAIDRLRAGQVDLGAILGSADLGSPLSEAGEALVQIAWRGEGRLRLAEVAISDGDAMAAERAFKMAIQLDPFFVGAYLNLSDHYRRLNAQEQSLDALDQGLERSADSSILHYSRGLALVRLNRHSEGKPALLRAVALAPENIDFFYTALLLLEALNERAQGLALGRSRYPEGTVPEPISQLLRRWSLIDGQN